MAKKRPQKIVHCRYPKCKFLHDTTEINKEDAIHGGKSNSYYHPDCYHTMQMINKIKDTYYREVNPMSTGQQLGQLVSIVNHMIFVKKIDVDYILFALNWFIKHKPGALKYPGGISYVVQDRNAEAEWNKEQQRKINAKIKNELAELNSNSINDDKCNNDNSLNVEKIGEFGAKETEFVYKPQRPRGFEDILH